MLFCSSIDLVNGRNPHTGKAIKIAAMKVTKFKAGANLKKTVNK
jgi:nucleoid DNA-binding protein